MKFIFVLTQLSFLVFCKYVSSEDNNKGQCQITEQGVIDWSITLLKLDDNNINEELFSTGYTGPLQVDSCSSNDNNFFEVTANGTHFLIRTTEQMKSFDEKTPKKSGTAIVNIKCQLICQAGISTLPIQFQVTDINSYDPTFLEPQGYSFDVPSPIMEKTDFTVYGGNVIARDLDFSNQDVIFTIEPNDFDIVTINNDLEKEYRAQFTAKNNINLNEDKIYTIKATDTGQNPHTRYSTTTIKLKPDKKKSFDTPSFEQPQYSFIYIDGNEQLRPTNESQSIKLQTNKPNSIQNNLEVSGELKHYLKPIFDPGTSTISLNVTNPIENPSVFLISSLSVTTDNTATTTIVVYLQSNSRDAPRFSKVLFKGNYQPDKEKVVLDHPIEVSSISTVNVSISDGENKDFFSIEPEDHHFIVKVDEPLPQNIIQQQRTILLRIQATSNGGMSYANLAITLPEAPNFDRQSYSVEYDAKQNEIKMNGSIGVTTHNGKDLNLTLKGDYKDYFKLEGRADEYKVNITSVLPDEVLREQSVIILEIIAAATSVEAYATLVIKIEGVDNGSGGTDKDKVGKTPYIVAVCVMAGSLIAIILAGVTFYLKFRKGVKSEKYGEDPMGHTDKMKFEKHGVNIPFNNERKSSSIADRRPTGFILSHPQDIEYAGDGQDEMETPDPLDSIRERKKSVIFDFNVKEIPVEKLDSASVENSDAVNKANNTVQDDDKSDTESMENIDSSDNADKNKDSDIFTQTQL